MSVKKSSKSKNLSLNETKEIKMSNLDLSLVNESIANVRPRPSRAVPHDALVSSEGWASVNQAVLSKKATLKQMFESMYETARLNDLAFFSTFEQFYESYRKACNALGLPVVRRVRKPKSA